MSAAKPITGLPLLSDVVGIDVRPATAQLYALVKGPALTGNGGVYRIDPTNGAATPITSSALDLDGTNFGFDFNPNSDRIRIVSEETRQNLRVNPNTGNLAFTDGDLLTRPPIAGACGLLAVGLRHRLHEQRARGGQHDAAGDRPRQRPLSSRARPTTAR